MESSQEDGGGGQLYRTLGDLKFLPFFRVGGGGGLGQMWCLKFFTLSWGEGDKVKSLLNFKLSLIIKLD